MSWRGVGGSCARAKYRKVLRSWCSPSSSPGFVESPPDTLPTKTIFGSSLAIHAARAHKEGPNALPAGVQRRGRGLRPHGGDDHVAFAAHHRRHTERLPCALRSQCPISRSHPSTAHPSGPQTPVPPNSTSLPRLAHPTCFPLSPNPPPTPRVSLVSSVDIVLAQRARCLTATARSMHLWHPRMTTSGRHAAAGQTCPRR